MQTPDTLFGDLFRDVQLSGVFPDSKTFVDCIPRQSPEAILAEYDVQRHHDDFDLRSFVFSHFDLPKNDKTGFETDFNRTIVEHIESLWPYLRREPDEVKAGSSLIPLPHPYIVPGGRFGEIYYWDSYFTMLGLFASGHAEDARNMIANFAHLIDTFGHIPNGNRSYFLSRSQPPFFALMLVEEGYHNPNVRMDSRYLNQLEKEYHFWMDHSSVKRAIEVAPGKFLNRYWDDDPSPRAESYKEDVELAEKSNRNFQDLFRDIRAACESGWDFSSRWMTDPLRLDTIETTSILPVDLNCLLGEMEFILHTFYSTSDDHTKAEEYLSLYRTRVELMQKYFWNEETGTFHDYNFKTKKQTDTISLAMLFPLFTGIASKEQANRVAEKLKMFMRPGGLVSTLYQSGQQWDAPNGWAPLQWIAVQGLRDYGFTDFANQIAAAWTTNVERVYRNTGKLLEKYNVEDISLEAGGGEYPVQDGFGWTNGIYIKLRSTSGRS